MPLRCLKADASCPGCTLPSPTPVCPDHLRPLGLLAQHWISTNKTFILALWHVANQHRCTTESSRQTFQRLRQLAGAPSHNHVLGANTLYHAEYIRHYTGIAPILLPVTLIDAVGHISWTQTKKAFLLNSKSIRPDRKHSRGIRLVKPSHYELRDLAQYAGVVVLPYSITNAKAVEQYAMNIPMFVPSVEFAQNMVIDRTATYGPYCPSMTSKEHPSRHHASPYEYDPNVQTGKDVIFWLEFAEIYHWPCVRQFESWADMYRLLRRVNRTAMSECMRQANKWRHFEELQNWCWVTNYLSQERATSEQLEQ